MSSLNDDEDDIVDGNVEEQRFPNHPRKRSRPPSSLLLLVSLLNIVGVKINMMIMYFKKLVLMDNLEECSIGWRELFGFFVPEIEN